MVRPIPINVGENFCSIPLAIGLFVSASLIVALCAKHAKQAPRKYQTDDPKIESKSPLPSPKQLITAISNKASPRKSDAKAKEGFGEGGLWQKAILMGEKCQPPDFAGVIYYDYSGNRISELPRSPRAYPMSPLRNFSLPVENNVNSMS
ncbi:hypothetical protein Adt_15394 [Abeliophyllum distichum]|uniref:Uncharacterized protein n=1 Tax=Abeliophyllum distichum TaxID=126358 RepID=A0ABD1U2C6_9LAMI